MIVPPRRARILIALSAAAQTRPPLDVYRYLLGETPPELVGLFVEEPALLAHAGAALARELVLSGLERRLDAASLERQLRGRSHALRRLFEAEGARLGLEHAFETVREERRTALERAAEHADALVVEAAAAHDALAVWSAAARLRALMLRPEHWRRSGLVAAVIDAADPAVLAPAPGPERERASGSASSFEAALRLARRTGASLGVLHVGTARPASHEALRRRARLAGVRLELLGALGSADAAALSSHTRGAGLLVLPPAASADTEVLAGLLDRPQRALVLLREQRE